MDELSILQAIRLKGRVPIADLAATLGCDPEQVGSAVADLAAAGLVVEAKSIKITPAGRERLEVLLADERKGVDRQAVTGIYDQFRSSNVDFKSLVADWQLKDGEPNDHEDSAYDAAVLARLDEIHEQVAPVVVAAADLLPRLRRYFDRLTNALTKVQQGDVVWFTRPIIDSYHTVWFELHEELILASGLTRLQEAEAGHAQ